MILPFLWMVSTSLKDLLAGLHYPAKLDSRPGGVVELPGLVERPAVRRAYWNSFYIAAIVVCSQLLTCSMAGYAFARINFPFRDTVFILFLATLMIPATGHDHPDLPDHARPRLARHPPGPDRAAGPVQRLRRLPAAPVHQEPAGGTGGVGDPRWRQPVAHLLADHRAADQGAPGGVGDLQLPRPNGTASSPPISSSARRNCSRFRCWSTSSGGST